MAGRVSRRVLDLELLDLEMDLLWGTEAGPELVLACARDGVRARFSKRVRSEVATSLATEANDAFLGLDSEAPPLQIEHWRRLLEERLGAAVELAQASGPSYVVHPDAAFRGAVELVRSDANEIAELRGANPGNWGADEWNELLEGHLGPWVMARGGQ